MSELRQTQHTDGIGLGLLEGLRSRRSIYHYKDLLPDLSLIEVALEHAALAPNHYKTAPWSFTVIHGEGRRHLADALEAAARRLERPTAAARARAVEAPVLVLAGVCPRLDRPKVREEEEVLAVATAVQNFMLALHGLGLGSLWTTGPLVTSSEVAALAKLTGDHQRLLGLILVGYAEKQRPRPLRGEKDPKSFVHWIG